MGGLGGHMPHIYENENLTFDKVIDILSAASNGDLDAEEKVDGQNLLISYSLKRGSTVAARNLSNIRAGGLDAHGMVEKFLGHAAEKVFLEGFSAFERAIESLDKRDIVEIFGEDADFWYNSELMDPENPNIITYDSKIIKIHDTGHLKMDKEENRPFPFDASEKIKLFDRLLSTMQKALEGKSSFSIARRASLALERLDSDEALNKAIEDIDIAIADVGLSRGSNIGQYLKNRLDMGIATEFLSPEKKEELINRILRVDGYSHLNVIKKGLGKEALSEIKEIMGQQKSILKQAIEPIEFAIHNFAVDLLEDVSSIFILDNKRESLRIKNKLLEAVNAMRENRGPDGLSDDAMAVMNRELRKIGGEERINSAIEGITFEYDGTVYKFTGNFAPVNQIVGMFYRSGTSDKIKEKEVKKESFKRLIDKLIFEEMKEVPTSSRYSDIKPEGPSTGKRTALFPGKFKPPHRGHFDFANKVARRSDVDELLIFISPLDQDPVSSRESLEIWETYLQNGEPNIKVEISSYTSPVQAVYEFVADPRRNREGDKVLLIKSSKDVGDTRFDGAQSYAARKNPGVEVVHIVEDPVESREGVVYSARDMRQALLNGDFDLIKKYVPPSVDYNQIINIINPPSLDKGVKSEMSSMGGGSVSGYAGGFGTSNKFNPYRRAKKPKVVRPKRKRRR